MAVSAVACCSKFGLLQRVDGEWKAVFCLYAKTSVCRALGFLKSGAKSFEGAEDQGLRLQREGAEFFITMANAADRSETSSSSYHSARTWQ